MKPLVMSFTLLLEIVDKSLLKIDDNTVAVTESLDFLTLNIDLRNVFFSFNIVPLYPPPSANLEATITESLFSSSFKRSYSIVSPFIDPSASNHITNSNFDFSIPSHIESGNDFCEFLT